MQIVEHSYLVLNIVKPAGECGCMRVCVCVGTCMCVCCCLYVWLSVCVSVLMHICLHLMIRGQEVTSPDRQKSEAAC